MILFILENKGSCIEIRETTWMLKNRARLEILSQHKEDLQTQVTRIKQVNEKFLDKDISWAERICTVIGEQGITVTGCYRPFLDYFNNCTCYYRHLWRSSRRKRLCFSTKRWRNLKQWLSRLADAYKSLAGKAAEAFPAILRSVVGAILRFLGTAVVFVNEKTWASIFLLQGLFGVWLIPKIDTISRQTIFSWSPGVMKIYVLKLVINTKYNRHSHGMQLFSCQIY